MSVHSTTLPASHAAAVRRPNLDHGTNRTTKMVFLVLLVVGLAYTAISLVSDISATGSGPTTMLPFILRRLGFDPASASAPFVATLVDVTGLVIYFTVASVVLRGTLL